MRTKLYLIFFILFFFSILQISKVYAADLGMQNLPEGAKYRIGHGNFYKIKFLPNGSQFAAVSNIGMWLYNTYSEEPQKLLANIGHIGCFDFSPDNKTLAMGGYAWIKFMDTETGYIRTFRAHGWFVTTLSFSPDGKILASGSWDQKVLLHEVETGKLIFILGGDLGYVHRVCFSPDGQTIASMSEDKTIRLWDTTSGKQKRILAENISNVGNMKNLAFSSNGKAVISVSKDKLIQVWDVETGKDKRISAKEAFNINSVTICPDNRIIAIGDNELIQLLNLETGKHIFTFRDNTGQVKDLDFSPDGKTIACVNDDNTIRLWDVRTGKRTLRIQDSMHSEHITDITFSPDGNTIATSSLEHTIMLWDAETGHHKRTLEGHTGDVYRVRFSPDGKIIASCGMARILLWDAKKGRHHKTIMSPRTRYRHEGSVHSLAFSPDGNTIATGGQDNTIRLWYTQTGLQHKTIRSNSEDQIVGTEFSPDGKTIVSASKGSKDTIIELWETKTGVLKHKLFSSMININISSFSPDGQTIAIVNHGNTIELWDVETANKKHAFIVDEVIRSVSFSPNGKLIAGCTKTGNILLWHAKTGNVITIFRGHVGGVTHLAFSPDGKTIASVGEDLSVLVWDVSSYTTNVDTKVSLSPSRMKINAIGQEITFSLNITGGENVSGYQATIHFDPFVLRYVESKLGDYLPTNSFFVSPIVEKNSITLAASSSGTESKGNGSLAVLTFETITNNTSTLNISDVILTDSAGVSAHPHSENAKIEKIATPIIRKEDVNSDGVINSQDLALVGKSLGQIGKNPADVNADGVVNIVDITLVEKAINKSKTKVPTKE